ncbi:hypothetical protein [Nostoc sp.]
MNKENQATFAQSAPNNNLHTLDTGKVTEIKNSLKNCDRCGCSSAGCGYG